jgi:hypothetical protein
VLDIRERVRRHYLILTLDPADRAAALNVARADGQAMVVLLAGLSQHLLDRALVPGLQPFVPDSP